MKEDYVSNLLKHSGDGCHNLLFTGNINAVVIYRESKQKNVPISSRLRKDLICGKLIY